jgi:cyclic nucleotide gated channel
MLQIMDEELLLKICNSLKPVYYNEHTYIVREGDPIDAMFFIKDGIAWTYTNSNGEVECLENGHYFGEELLELSFSKLSRLPFSPRTVVKTHGRIEAFALMAEDLKNIVSKNLMQVGKEKSETICSICGTSSLAPAS